MTTCSECGTENRLGRRFCGQCGAALSVKCASCGADNDPGDRFCGECGTPLNAAAPPGGDVDELDVPETLHALSAARLDGLTPSEQAVLQDAAVFGQSFTPSGVAALGEMSTGSVTQILDGLVAKQVLGFNDDRLSAERGQYHFLQALLRTTAYGTLSRRDRKSRHLAAARHLQEVWGDEAPELAEVLAAHFLDAAAADPDASDAPKIRAAACDTLADAGRRALSLALGAEALRAFDRAAELAEDEAVRATLLDQAARAALLTADYVGGHERLADAVRVFESLGDRPAAARSLAVLARTLFLEDRLDEAIELNRRAVAGLSEGSAEQAAAMGRHREVLDTALPIATAGTEVANEDRREAYMEAGMAALALDDQAAAESLIEFVANIPPAMGSPILRAGAARFAGLLAQRRDEARSADERLAAAVRELRQIEAPFLLGQVLLEHAELLGASGHDEEAAPLLAEAAEIFERLRATPWLERAQALGTRVAA